MSGVLRRAAAALGSFIGNDDVLHRKNLIVESFIRAYCWNREPEVMQIQIRRGARELTPDFERQVQRKLHFSLGRFSSDVRSVLVEFSHPATRGVIGDECVITIRTSWGARICIHESGEDCTAVTGRAAERAGRALERQARLRDDHGL